MTVDKHTPGMRTWRLADLVEDDELYPRAKIDSSNVADLYNALMSGAELPPIVVDTRGRIVDGYHRRRAYARQHGDEHELKVQVKKYESDAEAFADAVRYNRTHGRKLNSTDLTRAALRLADMGYDNNAIQVIVRIPAAKVEQVAARYAIGPAEERIPLKAGVRHLVGEAVDHEQIEAMTHNLGVSYGRLANQLIAGLDNRLLPDDEGLVAVLTTLHVKLGEYLP